MQLRASQGPPRAARGAPGASQSAGRVLRVACNASASENSAEFSRRHALHALVGLSAGFSGLALAPGKLWPLMQLQTHNTWCLMTHAYILSAPGAIAGPSSIYDFTALQYEKEVSLSMFKGQVVVILNIASE
jgi:hypothetical protein